MLITNRVRNVINTGALDQPPVISGPVAERESWCGEW